LATKLFFPSPSLPPKSFVKAKMEICIQPAAVALLVYAAVNTQCGISVNGMQKMESASTFFAVVLFGSTPPLPTAYI
jgi:hypothetical protein